MRRWSGAEKNSWIIKKIYSSPCLIITTKNNKPLLFVFFFTLRMNQLLPTHSMIDLSLFIVIAGAMASIIFLRTTTKHSVWIAVSLLALLLAKISAPAAKLFADHQRREPGSVACPKRARSPFNFYLRKSFSVTTPDLSFTVIQIKLIFKQTLKLRSKSSFILWATVYVRKPT